MKHCRVFSLCACSPAVFLVVLDFIVLILVYFYLLSVCRHFVCSYNYIVFHCGCFVSLLLVLFLLLLIFQLFYFLTERKFDKQGQVPGGVELQSPGPGRCSRPEEEWRESAAASLIPTCWRRQDPTPTDTKTNWLYHMDTQAEDIMQQLKYKILILQKFQGHFDYTLVFDTRFFIL